MEAVAAANLRFSYGGRDVLRGVSFSLEAGTLNVLLGANGSGKTTLLRLLNALVPLQGGELTVCGLDVRDPALLWQLRRRCGMVFQNPDNQFVSSVLEEDTAFGLRNYGVPEAEIPARVARALEAVGLGGFQRRAPHSLSGGQKQRAAIAGVLALEPELLLFDEATSMLDPAGRREVLELVGRLRSQGRTVLLVTHRVEEAAEADRVLLLGDGRLLSQGSPRAVLSDVPALRAAGLDPPLPVRLWADLRSAGAVLPLCPLTEAELTAAVQGALGCGEKAARHVH